MAKIYRFSHSMNGNRSVNKIAFESSFEPGVNYDGINAVEIQLENEDSKGISIALSKAETQLIFNELARQGFQADV